MKKIYNSPEVKAHKLKSFSLLLTGSPEQEEVPESIYNGGVDPDNPLNPNNNPGGGGVGEATEDDILNQG